MIIFYLKETGTIIGNIEGRVHSKEQLNMYLGDKEKVGRIIIQWDTEDGLKYYPKHPQKYTTRDLEKNFLQYLKNYKILKYNGIEYIVKKGDII